MLASVSLSRWNAAAFILYGAGHPLAGAAIAAARMSGLLRDPDLPMPQALAVAGRRHLGAALLLASAMRRAWWPAALLTPRGQAMLALSLPPCLADAARRPGDLDRDRWSLLRLADDLAFGAGVWAGSVRHCSAEPLLPVLH